MQEISEYEDDPKVYVSKECLQFFPSVVNFFLH